jgi:hypothetical protein
LGLPYSPPMADGRLTTNFVSLVAVMIGVWGLIFCGKIVEKFGDKSVIALCSGSFCILFALFAPLLALWSEKWFLVSFVIAGELLSITALIAVVTVLLTTMSNCSGTGGGPYNSVDSFWLTYTDPLSTSYLTR